MVMMIDEMVGGEGENEMAGKFVSQDYIITASQLLPGLQGVKH